jgi:hypothetical protein
VNLDEIGTVELRGGPADGKTAPAFGAYAVVCFMDERGLYKAIYEYEVDPVLGITGAHHVCTERVSA